MQLLDITKYCQDWADKIKLQIQKNGKTPIASFYITDNETVNRKYLNDRIKDCVGAGITARVHEPMDKKKLLRSIISDEADAIIVQTPIPVEISETMMQKIIPPEKDVTGFGAGEMFMRPTPGGIIRYLDDCGFRFEGANAVVIGRNNAIGKPIAMYLLDRNCTVTICHNYTSKSYLYTLLNWGDLVVCAVGQHGIFRASDADPKTLIIDVGITLDENNKFVRSVIDDINGGGNVPIPEEIDLLSRCMLLENIVVASTGVPR